jgi:chemotaxis protein histidine kinase CheA
MASAQWFDDQSALVQQGNLEAIAHLLNRSLPPNTTARVARKQERFGVLLESAGVPDRGWVNGLGGLRQIEGVQTFRIYGRVLGQTSPTWCIVFPAVCSNQHKFYGYFVAEAQERLKNLEQALSSFQQGHSPVKVHEMFLAVHTLKSGSASVGLHAIAKVAHGLEDVFSALRHVESVDAELEALLVQGYESLRIPLVAQFSGVPTDESEVLNRAASVIAEIQVRMGDCFERETPILTSAELGFDLVQNMFQLGVAQRLGDLERSLFHPDPEKIASVLRDKAEVFLGLAESMNLPGFGAIAQTVLTALEINPERVLEIAKLALADFSQGRSAVLGGDRQQGGFPSVALQHLAMLSPRVDVSEAFPENDSLEGEVSLDDVFGQYVL